jgi:hypothetical protein
MGDGEMNTESRKKELQDKMGALRREEMDLEQKEFLEEMVPAAQRAVGDTFAYRNNSRSGGDKFDTFYRVIAFTPRTRYNYGVTVVLERAEIDDEGRASLEMEAHTITPGASESWNHVGLLASCVPCPREEYAAMRIRVLAAFENPVDLIEALSKQ